ncbi:MAG: hypothetical protein ABIO05_05030 [Ferruginibacter sp.]
MKLENKKKAQCHLDRPHYAKGFCSACYLKQNRINNPKYKEQARKYSKQYRIDNPTKHKEWGSRHFVKNKEKILANQKQYYNANKETRLNYQHQYKLNNKEIVKSRYKRYQLQNKESIRQRVNNYKNSKYKTDLNYKIKTICRARIHVALKRAKTKKQNRTITLIGCGYQEYKDYLEKQFQKGMLWDNYGTYWEIDHIRPISSFDLTNVEEQKLAFNYSNTQPLTVEENLKKHAKFTKNT